MFNAVLRKQYFPPAWEHAAVVTTLKPAEDPTVPYSYIHLSLMDTFCKLFEKILLTKARRDVNER
jgi:hypothetical protein